MNSRKDPFSISFRSLVGFSALALSSLLPIFIPRSSQSAAAVVDSGVKLQSFGSHSRLIIPVDAQSKVNYRQTADGFELEFPGLSLIDFGAPIGNEAAWAEQLGRTRQDARLKDLKLREVGDSVHVTAKWVFSGGENAPANPMMEKFEYRESNPPRYVLDFWVKPGPTLKQAKVVQKIKAKEADLERRKQDARARENRRIANDALRLQREDVSLFCRQPLSAENDVFLPFTAAHEALDLSRWISTQVPDADYNYLTPVGDEKDAQYFRLALSLYRSGKYALTIKTLDFLDAEFPASQTSIDAKFLRANALWKIEQEDASIALLSELAVTAKSSPVALQSVLFLAARNTQKKQHLAALENFLWLVERYPQHRLAWLFHLGAAENLYLLKQTDRAAKEYEWVTTHARADHDRAEAAFRLGDVYLMRGQYESAVTAYYQALQKFPDQKGNFPLVHLNRAESLYWLGQYSAAKETYAVFLKLFPGHPAGWRATFRTAEILMRSKNESERNQGREALVDTINRYPLSAGATLARSRLAPCGDHGGLDLISATRFFEEESSNLATRADGEIIMDSWPDFRALAYVRTLMVLGHVDIGIDVGIKELQKNPRGSARDMIGITLRALFRKSLLEKLAGGHKFEALKFYTDHAASIPRARDAIPVEDLDYLLKLSQAASDLDLGSVGVQLADDYRIQVQGIDADANRHPATENGVQKNVDSLAKEERARWKTEEAFTDAKALWVKSGMEKEAYIRSQLMQVNEENPHSGEKEILLAMMEEREGNAAAAMKRAVQAQMLHPALNRSPRLKSWIASLQERSGQLQAAAETYRSLIAGLKKTDQRPADVVGDPMADLGLSVSPTASELVFKTGELLGRLGKWEDAAAVYSQAVDHSIGGNQALYELARALRRTGEITDQARADRAMEKLSKSSTDDFWKKLALRAANSDSAKEGEQ